MAEGESRVAIKQPDGSFLYIEPAADAGLRIGSHAAALREGQLCFGVVADVRYVLTLKLEDGATLEVDMAKEEAWRVVGRLTPLRDEGEDAGCPEA